MTIQKRHEDRRIRRTRQALQQALMEVVLGKNLDITNCREIEKRFAEASIQEITARADVSRGTFYLHFTDKYMLADAVVRELIHQKLASALPPEPRWERMTLHLLIQAMLNLFEGKYHHQHQSSSFFVSMFEQVAHEELTDLVLTWLKEAKSGKRQGRKQLEAIASVVNWAIVGTAIQWSQEEIMVSSEQMADIISQMVTEGVSHLAPDALPK